MNFDTIIRNGTVVDGTGSPARRADVGIVGDELAAIGDLGGAEAGRVLDASGQIVCPGFIDVHVHSELALLGGPDRYAPLKMGVTTQLASPDGFSWAPLGLDRLKEMRDYLHVFYSGADDCLDIAADLSIDEMLSLFRDRIPSNIVLQVPHASVRLEATGWDDRPATDDEIKAMERMTRDWMERGAKAFATGLEYEPMRRADLRELVALSKVTAEYGGIYVAHQRGYGDNIHIGCAETFEIGLQAGIPVHISHLTIDDAAYAQLEQGTAKGADISFDMYPYPAGCTHLLLNLPPHAQAGSPDQVKERLRDPAFRRSIEAHIERAFPKDRVTFASVGTPQHTGWEGMTLGEVQKQLGLSLTDTVCDIIIQTDFQALMIYHWSADRFPFLETTFKHPLHMVGTDGVYVGKRPHPRGYGSYPKILKEFVRENKWLSVERAVYKMTGFPASRFRIERRGVLREGYYADLVVFDPQRAADGATFADARIAPQGIGHVMVNGHFAIADGVVHEGNFGRIVS